jgi:hypothetical protein
VGRIGGDAALCASVGGKNCSRAAANAHAPWRGVASFCLGAARICPGLGSGFWPWAWI